MSEEILEQPTTEATEPQPAAEPPSFEQFSQDRKSGKVDATTGGDEISPGGNQWDGDKNKFVNPVRDEQGRFAKVRESLAQSEKKSRYVKAVLEGTVQPDESMDTDTWAAARNAQIRNETDRITPPDFGTERPADGAEIAKTPAAERQLSPEETKHFESHDSMLANIAAKAAVDPETRNALTGFRDAVQLQGVPTEAVDYLGHCVADTANAHEVFLALGKNPDAVVMYSQLHPQAMQRAILQLSREIAQAAAAVNKPAPPKPKPPEPVGARATANAFDVNDDTMDSDEWARNRNRQLAERGHR